MHTLATTVLTIGLQLALGALFCAVAVGLSPHALRGLGGDRRRAAAVRVRAAAKMMRSLPLAVGLGMGGAALLVALGADPGNLLHGTGISALLVVGVIPTSGAYLMHDAARQEAAGSLRIARRQARFSGRLIFWGALVLAAWASAELLVRPGSRQALLDGPTLAAPVLAASMFALGGSAFIGLLAGLSRKPRPSGSFAVLLYFCGLAGLLGVAGSL